MYKIYSKDYQPTKQIDLLDKIQETRKFKTTGVWLTKHHSCGCRLRMNIDFVWCSGVKCDFMIKREEFFKNNK